MFSLSLNGKWQMKNCTTGQTISARVPGTDFGNLIENGVIKNPLISGKEEEALKTAEHDYEFSRFFEIDESTLAFEHIRLQCNCLDTLCTCSINGKKAFVSKNAYVPADFEIKDYLVAGSNSITLHFESAYKYIKAKQEENSLPKNSNGVDGIPYIRKPGCHFGWDWGPCVPYCGITDDISVCAYNRRIENIAINQETNAEKSVVTVSADNADTVYILTPSGEKITSDSNVFEIDNPQLWYTRDMSQKERQPLYSVVFENAEDKVVKKIGLRSIRLDRSKDEYGENFCLVLNGEKMFAKGANLIPFSAIYEDSDNSTVDYYIDLALRSNFNIIRVWGGGSYASDYLLEQCDEKGLLIWQDFCFACQLYPFYDSDFTANVLEEVEANVARMTTHPSLAVWCGNNEIETMFSYMPASSKLMKAYKEFFYETLPNAMAGKTQIDYIPTSPIGESFLKNISSDNYGDTHMWNVWHGLKPLDYYQSRYSRFLSEFGLESLPSMKAIKTFAKEDQLEITSDSFNSHQKCVGGNKKMLFYLTEMFDFPQRFEALPYLTGIVQAECIKNATVHFRQNKGRCNGSIYWQYNDVWNCPSWSSVDFEGVPKALQYKARDFFAPVAVTCKKDGNSAVLVAHNDTLKEQELNITLTLYTINGRLKSKEEQKITLAANSFERLPEITVDKDTVLRIDCNGITTTEFFAPPVDLKLRKAKIKSELKDNKLYLSSDKVVYNLCIDSDEIPSENYFSLVPDEVKVVKFDKAPSSVDFICANNIEFKHNDLKKKLFRLFYRLEPLNIGNYIYYSKN